MDLGGIAKGYTSNRIMEIFQEYGVTSAMVSLGGNVQTLGKKPDGTDWQVGIRILTMCRETFWEQLLCRTRP